mgnify:CR=1 FL=1
MDPYKMKKKNQLLYFEIKNTIENTVQPVPGKFISTKQMALYMDTE